MNKNDLGVCYRAVKDQLLQLGLVPTDKTLKEILSCADIQKPDFYMVQSPAAEMPWMPSFRNLIDAMKYTDDSHTEETHYFKAAKEIDRVHTKTSHGRLSDAPNLFARALATYVEDKVAQENRQFVFTQFENENHLWYSDYYLTHPNHNEFVKFEKLFDQLIDDLKDNGYLKEITTARKLTMKDVDNIIDRRKQQSPAPAGNSLIAAHML